MKIESLDLELRGVKGNVSSESTRKNVESTFGRPDDVGGVSKKAPLGMIVLYEGVELHFDGGKPESKLKLIFKDQEVGDQTAIEISIPLLTDDR